MTARTRYRATTRLAAWQMRNDTGASAAATIPSSHQWLAVATTAKVVAAGCRTMSHRHRLVLVRITATAMNKAHATCTDGMAASWGAILMPCGPYTDWP